MRLRLGVSGVFQVRARRGAKKRWIWGSQELRTSFGKEKGVMNKLSEWGLLFK